MKVEQVNFALENNGRLLLFHSYIFFVHIMAGEEVVHRPYTKN